jgi:hypothetical protein
MDETIKNYVICARIFNHKSHGCVLLHKLCHQLNNSNRKCALIFFVGDRYETQFHYLDSVDSHPSYFCKEYDYFFPKKNEINDFMQNSIVIYPEIIPENPLNAKFVCRYMLNSEGAIKKGLKIRPGDSDFFLTHHESYSKNYNFLLFHQEINMKLLQSQAIVPLKNRKIDVTYIGKGSKYEQCKIINNTYEITRTSPEKKEDLYKLLGKTRFFYTYDNLSLLTVEAILLGCIPIFLSKTADRTFISKSLILDFILPDHYFKYTKNIEIFNKIDQLRDQVSKFFVNSEENYKKNVIKFANLIENHFFNINKNLF